MSDEAARNPFFVLGVPGTATPAEIERAGQKLLGQLAIGVKSALSYTSPLGAHERTESLVREALAALRDADVRAACALEARALALASERTPRPSFGMPDVRRALGWNTP